MFSNKINIDKLAIIFTHIPKCAGTSFRESIVLPNIDERYIYRSGSFFNILKYRQDFKYIIGHWPFGIENFIHPLNPARKRDKILLTFLREPIDHLISFYYFQKQQGKYSAYAKDIRGKSILEFYTTTPKALNMQTRFCAGVFYEQFFKRIKTNYCGTKLQLKHAKENLINKFNFVGQLENITNDMELFANSYNLELKYQYAKSTKTNNRPKVKDLSSDVIKTLTKLNKLDVELYRFAKEEIFSKRNNS